MLKKSTRLTLALLFLSLFCSFAEAAATSQRAPENDHSLTPAQYVSAGAPASDRAWIGRDYLTAAKALSKLADRNTALLPRYGSAQSGSYFARMISTDNLADADNTRLSLESRVRLLVESGQSLNRVVLLYARTRNSECTFDQEMVALTAHNLRIYARLIPLIDEFSANLRPSDPEYAAWVNSLSQLRSGGTNMVSGALDTLEAKTLYRPAVLASYVAELRKTVPPIARAMPPLSRQELIVRVNRMAADEADTSLRAQLQGLAQLLSADQGR